MELARLEFLVWTNLRASTFVLLTGEFCNFLAGSLVNTGNGRIRFEWEQGALILAIVLTGVSAEKLGALGGLAAAALLIGSLLLHEVGHLAMAQSLGVPVKAIGLCLKGAYLRRGDSLRPGIELLIAVSGPAANLLLFLWFRDGNSILRWVALLNLVLAASNLIPVKGTDGARICQSIRALWSGCPAIPSESQA